MAFGVSSPSVSPDSIVGAVEGLFGIGSTAPTNPPAHSSVVGMLPWALVSSNGSNVNGGSPLVNSPFFKYMSPDGSLWDKLLPYRLLVIDSSKGNKVVGGNKPKNIKVESVGAGTLAFTPMGFDWEFHFPITPQQLNIVDNYSINTSATLRGVMEEHSGVRFKNITVRGTFGVWPGRQSIVKPPSTPNLLQSVFGGVISAAQNVVAQAQTVVNSALTGNSASKPTTVRPNDPNDPEQGLGTGYYQTIMLQQFLEQYAEAKRNPANAGWRLVFDIPKQNQAFVVTPLSFVWNESANKPMEIDYTLQFKAWRRIDINHNFTDAPPTVTQLTPGVLQQVLNTISDARNTVAAAHNLIGAVRSDVDNILNIVRQTGLFVKDLVGTAIALSDLPSQLITDVKSTASDFMASVNTNNLSGSGSTNASVTSAIKSISNSAKQKEGLSQNAVSNGQLGTSASNAQSIDPSNNIFSSPQKNPEVFDQVPVNSLKLNSAQQSAYQNEIDSVRSFTVADLKEMKGTIVDLTVQLENSFGASDSYYSSIYGTPFAENTSNQQMSLDQYDILQKLYDLIQSYDVLTATTQLDSNNTLNSMEYVQSLAQDSDIPFSISNSKIQMPVPYNTTLEGIALRYLGDADRWIEIATLNNLREPYIDESGFTYDLLSNGDGRNIVVGSDENLYVGQSISISSSVQSPTTRTILDIVTLSQTSFLLTLDGEANLDIYKTSDSAYLKAYLPGTVNSSNVIFIPSDIETTAYDQISIPSSVANVDLVGVSKVDWLLNPSQDGRTADVAITQNGDFRLAAGITNLIQPLRTMFGVQVNSDYTHPNFGMPFKVGSSVADLQVKDLYSKLTQMVTSDSRYSAVNGLQIVQNGSSLVINMAVGISGIKGVFPISFALN